MCCGLNCFDVIPSGDEITSVDVAWGQMSNGGPSKVLVYEDPNDDGDPTDAVLLTQVATTVANAGTNSFTTVSIPPTNRAWKVLHCRRGAKPFGPAPIRAPIDTQQVRGSLLDLRQQRVWRNRHREPRQQRPAAGELG